MEKKFVQNGITEIPYKKTQRKTGFIRTLVIGISVNINLYLRDLKLSSAMRRETLSTVARLDCKLQYQNLFQT